VRQQHRHDVACYKSRVTDKHRWIKSTRCGNNTCVEVAADGADVLVRDGKNPDREPLTIARPVWHEFLDDVAANPDAWR
jgi:hypothetical protein